jgi:hypothetical protein
MDKYPAGQLGGHMDLNGQVLDESSLEQENETTEEKETASEIAEKSDLTTGMIAASELNVSALGVASVLFPATPPLPLNPRLIRGRDFHDGGKKPRGLAGAAGVFQSVWDEPEDAAEHDRVDRGWT